MGAVSRRDFIAKTAGGAVGLVLCSTRGSPHVTGTPLPISGKRTLSSVFGGLQIGVMTYSFRDRPLDKALENIVDIGFSSVELYSGHLDPFKASDKEINSWRKRFAEAGVRIRSYYVDFPDQATHEQTERPFVAAQLLGVDILSSTAGKHLVSGIDKVCQKFKMKVGLHNELWPNKQPDQIEGPQDFLEVLGKSSKWINITLDVGHFYAAGSDPVQFIGEHHDRIVSLHLKDRERDPQHRDLPFGQGTTPLIPVVKTLKKLHFQHAANIEWEVEGMDPVAGVTDALAYLKRDLV
jgi:sugar phosphate isomerase/epimerase